ncbi:MAG: substrate-binding domain-containing protein [Muribaculaceae bacterium]|nr:substrate-binding domain-containing protein [Muribaculaceae bacterium]MBQ9217193.1 substrate-binding domain-containing protein [Muribaculaceae bacterium]
MTRFYTYILLFLFLFLLSCSSGEKRYRIGVSQCSDDIWRDKQNSELRIGAYYHDNVELRFASAYDSDERQVQQIDSLVAEGIDLLIVAPNQVSTISSAIDRAYDKGIPVIVFERKTSSQKYTAYIGADNYEMGRLMGEHIVSRLNGSGTIIEIMGLRGSSPAIERHNGFCDAIAQHPGIQVAATLQGDWTEATAYHITRQWLSTNANTPIDLVFGMNDRSAMGARKAFAEVDQHLPLFCGIDGLPGEQGGIRLVRDSLLDASYIYPTHGDQVLQLAIDILDGKPYDKETHLMSALVTGQNAQVLLLESDEIMRQSRYLEQLNARASGYLQQLANQRTIILLAIGIIALLLLLLIGIHRYNRQKTHIQLERTQMERDQLDFYTQLSHELRTPLTLIEGPLTQLADTAEMRQATSATSSLLAIVRRNTRHLTKLINKMLEVQTSGRTTGMTSEQIDALTVKHPPLMTKSQVPRAQSQAPPSTTLLVYSSSMTMPTSDCICEPSFKAGTVCTKPATATTASRWHTSMCPTSSCRT